MKYVSAFQTFLSLCIPLIAPYLPVSYPWGSSGVSKTSKQWKCGVATPAHTHGQFRCCLTSCLPRRLPSRAFYLARSCATPRTFIWCCYHSNGREFKVTATHWQGFELTWKSFTDTRYQGIVCSLTARLPSLAIVYIGVGSFYSGRGGSPNVLWSIWRHRTSSWWGARGEVTPQPGLEQQRQRLESSNGTGSPRGSLGDRGRWQMKKKETANERGTCPNLSVAKHCIAWRAVPPNPVWELGRLWEGTAASAHSRDLSYKHDKSLIYAW